MEKFTLYSQLVGNPRYRTINSSNDFENLYNKGIKEASKDVERKRNYFIVEHGVKAIKIETCTII